MGQNQNAIGLDVGTSRIVAARRVGDAPVFESQLNAFVRIPYSRISIASLEREDVLHSAEEGEIAVHGDESEKFAGLLNAEIRRPMNRGVLDPREPGGLQSIREIVARILHSSPGRGRQRICFTVPAAPLGAEGSLTYHEATLRHLLTDLGYEPSSINEGLAVIYSELGDSNYTGIGISCGGGLYNLCLAYLSVPVLNFSIPKAGDYIDNSAAQITGERANRIRLAKEESFHFNGFFSDKIKQVISVYYDLIRSLVAALKDGFTRASNLPKFNRPIPIVLSGGTALPVGFRERFEALVTNQNFPVRISEIRLAESPLYATAKGALACALSEP